MAADFTIGQHDTAPEISDILKDDLGNIANLTGASVKFHMTDSTGVVITNAVATIVGTPANGQVQYNWVAVDTAVATGATALNKYEWRVTFSDGTIIHFPNGETRPTVEVAAVLAEP